MLTSVDEQIVYNALDADETSIWSLLLASGYLRIIRFEEYEDTGFNTNALNCELAITNLEVKRMFCGMIREWFASHMSYYNDFIRALLTDDLKAMNVYMNKVALGTFSYFDIVLGLMVELNDRYVITSNRESGFGKYDVMLEPKKLDDAIILEFKVQDTDSGEKELEDTVKAALKQIEDKHYETVLIAKGIEKKRIRKYGFAFCGNEVLIGN